MVRMMEEADIPGLAELFLKGRRQAFHWVDPTLFELHDFAEQTGDEQIWVAERGGALCGFISIWPSPSFVHHLYVSAEWQGHGIGRALLAEGLARHIAPSLKVALRNTRALAFYQRLGWQKTAEMGNCELMGAWQRLTLRP